GPGPDGHPPPLLFTENETNSARLFGAANGFAFVKDACHDYIVNHRLEAVNPKMHGTKAAAQYVLNLPAGEQFQIRLRLRAEEEAGAQPLGKEFDRIFDQRIQEADAFYSIRIPDDLTQAEALVARQAYAGLLWSKQYYHYVVKDWLEGDPAQPSPPA